MATEAEVFSLAHDRNDHWRRSLDVESTCVDLPGADSWDCCEVHRQLQRESDAQRQRAASLQPNPVRGSVFSVNWWRSLNMGLQVSFEDPMVRGPDGQIL